MPHPFFSSLCKTFLVCKFFACNVSLTDTYAPAAFSREFRFPHGGKGNKQTVPRFLNRRPSHTFLLNSTNTPNAMLFGRSAMAAARSKSRSKLVLKITAKYLDCTVPRPFKIQKPLQLSYYERHSVFCTLWGSWSHPPWLSCCIRFTGVLLQHTGFLIIVNFEIRGLCPLSAPT